MTPSAPTPDGSKRPRRSFWERTWSSVVRYCLIAIAGVAGAVMALPFVDKPEGAGFRTVCGVIIAAAAVLIALLEILDALAKRRREKEERSALDQLRARHTADFTNMRTRHITQFAGLSSGLAGVIRHQGNGAFLEQFIGECAERFLTLVGNENGYLRVALYYLDGREDDKTPEDDRMLVRVTDTLHGRTDAPRMRFQYTNPDEREVFDSLDKGDLIPWPDLTEAAPSTWDPSKKYKAFYTMPVISRDRGVLGMVTCDSTEVGVLGEQHEQSLRMIAHLVGVGLTLRADEAEITRPPNTGGEHSGNSK